MAYTQAGRPIGARCAGRATSRGARYLAVPLVAGSLVAALAGTSSATARPAAGSGPINVGVIAPFTGPAAEFGTAISAPCYAATLVINKAGGVLGHKLNCDPINDTGDPADAVPNVERAIGTTSNLDEIVGEESNTAATVIPLVERAKIPMVSTNGLVAYDSNGNPYFYRMSPSDNQNGAAYSYDASVQKFKRIAIIFQNDIGATGNLEGALQAAKNLHLDIVQNLTIPGEETSYASVIERVIASNPQAIMFYADTQTSATFMSEYFQLANGNVPPTITAGGQLTADFYTGMSKAVPTSYLLHKVFMVGQLLSKVGDAFKTYAGAVESAPQIKSPQLVLGEGVTSTLYDGINLMSLAMIEAKSTTGSVYNKYIVKIASPSKGAVVVHNFTQGLRALKAGKTIQYVGVGGAIHFNKYHNYVGSWGVFQFLSGGTSTTSAVLPGSKVLSLIH